MGKRISILSGAIILTLSLQVCEAMGPFGGGPGSGRGSGGPFGGGSGGGQPEYVASKVITITGKVTGSTIDANPNKGESGLHLYVETNSGEYTVHVAPEWVIKQRNIQFLEGEIVTVKGAKFSLRGKPNMYASTLIRKFSSLSKDKQKEIAIESLSTDDLSSLAKKYNVTIQEIENIKTRVEPYWNNLVENALFPEYKLRDEITGRGLWRGRSNNAGKGKRQSDQKRLN